MKQELIYREYQHLRKWWIMLILLLINLYVLYTFIQQIGRGIPMGSNPMSNTHMILSTVLVLFITSLFFFFRIDTYINKDGIYIRFLLFIRPKFVPWEKVAHAEVKKKNLLTSRYGGFGIRFGVKSTAYIASGQYVLELKLKKGRVIHIGTQNPNALAEFLEKLNGERK